MVDQRIVLFGVDYDEYNPDSYRGVEVEVVPTSLGVAHKICSGKGFEQDMKDAQDWAKANYPDTKRYNRSSVDHYQMDSNKSAPKKEVKKRSTK